eukprot:143607_1
MMKTKKKKLPVYNEEEMKNVIRIIFEERYKDNAMQIAENLMAFYPENGYDWNDIVDDFEDTASNDCFGLDNVIETLNSGAQQVVANDTEKKFVWGLLKRCIPRPKKENPNQEEK